ncbi:hypothetical protein HRbin22_01605 [Candidatus Thermoflexus japonica]|uniref:Uncharacterized protein n=1 Tax=Candidatus Thermoflexus japonica TaxID=2035417 RepID=A0A2H5Y7D4_9CHLR|nr:hypothetical protein HRbin22_01605 [Candidatus Thermoflexus japonica]
MCNPRLFMPGGKNTDFHPQRIHSSFPHFRLKGAEVAWRMTHPQNYMLHGMPAEEIAKGPGSLT